MRSELIITPESREFEFSCGLPTSIVLQWHSKLTMDWLVVSNFSKVNKYIIYIYYKINYKKYISKNVKMTNLTLEKKV